MSVCIFWGFPSIFNQTLCSTAFGKRRTRETSSEDRRRYTKNLQETKLEGGTPIVGGGLDMIVYHSRTSIITSPRFHLGILHCASLDGKHGSLCCISFRWDEFCYSSVGSAASAIDREGIFSTSKFAKFQI